MAGIWFSVVLFLFLVDRICPLMQEHFLWPLLKRKPLLMLNKGLSVFKSCDQIVKKIYVYFFPSLRAAGILQMLQSDSFQERAVFNLILGGQFWKCTKCEWSRILTHRTGILCKRCQTYTDVVVLGITSSFYWLGTIRSDDGDGNGKFKKTIG